MNRCPNCQTDNPTKARFCMDCGTALPSRCPNCNAELPPEARFCMHCGQPMRDTPAAPPAQEEDAGALTGERRTITAMFADVKGSTSLAEQIDVEAWVEIMKHVLQVLGAEIHRFGGEVDRYEGDGLVAFFGASAAHEDDPERAVLAALAMQEAVQRYAAELAEGESPVEILLRVGLSTGEVVTAHLDDARQHGEETAMGRAIAVAARMEPAAEPGTVLVSEDTYRLVAPLFDWLPVGAVAAKGIREPVPAYRPLAHRAAVGKGRGIPGLESPLVGRDAELEALHRAVDNLQHGIGGIVTLVGEAGIGKSRLVTEAQGTTPAITRHLAKHPDRRRGATPATPEPNWVEGRCLSYGDSIAYLPWLDMLRSVLRVAQDAPSHVVRAALHEQVQALCPDCYDAVYPYLCRLMSLPLGDEYEALRSLQGESLRAEIFSAMLTLIESAARQGPLVMVCEDLHWADATSLALLERVLALTDRVALLLICAFRPDTEHPCWQIKETAARLYRHRHTDLWLDALSLGESQALVGNLLRVEALPSDLRAKILDHAEGNPFYVEEILRTLIDDGAIVRDEAGQWRAARELADIPIPDTLHGVLMARIDRLQDETRSVLRLASVIGRVFLYRVLSEIAREEVQLDAQLLTLQRQQLIRERTRVPELEYIFKHELTREAAYNGLLQRERRSCHRQVAQALERLFQAQMDEQAGLLAHHWERAEEPDRAVAYLLRAGEQARLTYANEEAADYYGRALRLLDALPADGSRKRERLTALSGLGKVYFGSGRIGDAEFPLREAIALGKEVELPARELVRIYWWLCEVLFWQIRWGDQLRLAEEGLVLLGEDAGSLEAALMDGSIAIAQHILGNESKAHEHMRRSAQVAQGLPYVEELRPAYTNACNLVYIPDKDVGGAERWIAAYEERARRHHDLRGLGEARDTMGCLRYAQGKLDQAIAEHERALDLYARIGDSRLMGTSMYYLAQAHIARGALTEAEALARHHLKVVEPMGSTGQRMMALRIAAMLAVCMGHPEESLHAMREAFAARSGPETGAYAQFWSQVLARAYLALGRRRQALERLQTPGALVDPNSVDPMLLDLLSMLEQACDTRQDFYALCDRYRAHRPETQDPCYAQFVGWYLRPADVQMRLGQTQNLPLQSPGWTWVDPCGDCSHTAHDGLIIHAANGRDMWSINWSAPRLMRAVSGDLAVQTVCLPAMDGRPAIGGLLLWVDERNYLRLDRGVCGPPEVALTGCVGNQGLVIGRGRLSEATKRVYLRLERIGGRVQAYCSADGEQWYTVGHVSFPVGDPIQVGMHAIGSINRTIYHGAHPDGTAIRFESFQLSENEAI